MVSSSEFITLAAAHINKHTFMSKPVIEGLNTWPRNLSTLRGGGLSTLAGGGLSTLRGDGASSLRNGGLSTLRGGGMSTLRYGGLSTLKYGGLSTLKYGGLSTLTDGGLSTLRGGGLSSLSGGGMSTLSTDVYRSNIPPWPYFLRELETRGYDQASELIRKHLPKELWPENFFK